MQGNKVKNITHREMYPEPSNYEISTSILLEATREKGVLNPDLVNPILKLMRGKLNDFRINEQVSGGSFIIMPDRLEDFLWEEVAGRVLFSYSAKWRIVDTGFGSTERFNNYARGRLRRGLMELEVKGEKGIILRLIDVNFQGEVKTGNWPKSRFAFETF